MNAHRQSPAGWPHQVDLHNDRGGPTQTLVDAQQHIGEHNPSPGWSEDDQKWHGQSKQPARDEHPLATNTVTESARKEVGSRFDDAEAHNEGEDSYGGSQTEHLLTKQRHDAALESHHTADKGVDDDQQRELLPVGTQTKLND